MKKNNLILAAIFISVLTHLNIELISYFIFFLIVAGIIFIPKKFFPLYLIIIIVSPDLNILKIYTGQIIINNSIYLNTFLGITLITLSSIFILIISFIRSIDIKISTKIFTFIFLPLLIPLTSIVYTDSIKEFISSSSIIVVLLSVFYLAKSSQVNIDNVLKVIYVALIVKMVTNIMIVGVLVREITTVYIDSTAYLFPIVLLFKRSLNSFPIFSILFLLNIINLLIFPSRGRMILLFLTVILALFIIKSMSIKFKLVASSIIIVISILFAGTFLGGNQAYNYSLWKITTINPLDEDNESANVRLLETKNILYESYTQIYPLFIGKGYGGYFSDKQFPFDKAAIIKGGAFPIESILSGKYYRPHSMPNILLLKIGLIPTLIFYIGIFYLLILILKSKLNNKYVFIFFPFLAVVMYTQKLQIIFAILVLIIHYFLVEIKEDGELNEKDNSS